MNIKKLEELHVKALNETKEKAKGGSNNWIELIIFY